MISIRDYTYDETLKVCFYEDDPNQGYHGCFEAAWFFTDYYRLYSWNNPGSWDFWVIVTS